MTSPPPPYRLLAVAGFHDYLAAASKAVQDAVAAILPTLLADPLPGAVELDVRSLEGWWPDAFTATLPDDHGWLVYRVPAGHRVVQLVSLVTLAME